MKDIVLTSPQVLQMATEYGAQTTGMGGSTRRPESRSIGPVHATETRRSVVARRTGEVEIGAEQEQRVGQLRLPQQSQDYLSSPPSRSGAPIVARLGLPP
jgi:hypothetical protein